MAVEFNYTFKNKLDLTKARKMHKKYLKDQTAALAAGLAKPDYINYAVRLPAPLLHEIICYALALNALKKRRSNQDKYVTADYLKIAIEDFIDENLHGDDRVYDNYFCSVDYRIYEQIKSINKSLSVVGKCVDIKRCGQNYIYYADEFVCNDWLEGELLGKNKSLNSSAFRLVNTLVDYEVMNALYNFYNDRKQVVEAALAGKYSHYTDEKKEEYRRKNLPMDYFIDLADFPYGVEKTERIRQNALALGRAIIKQQPVKVSYWPHHLEKPDDLEFHPHFIRKNGARVFCYGYSRSIKWHEFGQHTLVNIALERIQSVTVLDGREATVSYQSAYRNDLDYKELFRERMTFNAPWYNKDSEELTRVVLKVRREVPTTTNPRRPFTLLMKEPLHHSQCVCADYPIDEEYGYVSLFIKDANYIKPLLLPRGADIEVLEPESLRAIMAKEVEALFKIYHPEKYAQIPSDEMKD